MPGLVGRVRTALLASRDASDGPVPGESRAFRRLRAALPWIEIVVVYGFLMLHLHPKLDDTLLVVAFTATGILFALFYHYLGLLAGCLFLVLALLKRHDWSIVDFTGSDYATVVICLASIYTVGQFRYTLQQTIDLLRRKGDLLESRTSSVLSELISFEVSHRVFLEDMYFRLDDPVYLYHELRRQSLTAEDETEFIAQVFKVLNRYLFVEKGVVYRREGEGHYDAVFRYGAATLPERIDRKERPVYFELLQSSRKVVFSRFPERHGFLVAIPVFGTLSDEPVLLLMIERIRFVMLTARSSQSLKAVSLLLRGIFERKFQREELQSVSAAKSALVLDRETTRRALPGRLAFLDEAGIPWRAVAVKTGEAANLDELALKMELALRILDEMYLLDGEIVAVLLFTEHTGAVFARLRGAGIGADDIREYPRADLQARLARAS